VGRVDRYYVKRFEDETEMRTYLVVDASASMGYRRRGVSKLSYAGYLAGAFAYLLGKQGDPAGLLLFDDADPPLPAPQHRARADPGDLPPARRRRRRGDHRSGPRLGHVGELLDKRSLVLFFTDLLDAEPDGGRGRERARRAGPLAERLRQLRARGHDVVLSTCSTPTRSSCPSTT
jgi:uncharacterized protein (DUF58 family)